QSHRQCSDQYLLVLAVLQWYRVCFHHAHSSPGAQLIEDAQLAYYTLMEPIQRSHRLLKLRQDQPMLGKQPETAQTLAAPSVPVFVVASSLKQVSSMDNELIALADPDGLMRT